MPAVVGHTLIGRRHVNRRKAKTKKESLLSSGRRVDVTERAETMKEGIRVASAPSYHDTRLLYGRLRSDVRPE